MKPILCLIGLFPAMVFGQTNPDEMMSSCNVDGSTTLYHLESDTWAFTDSADAHRETLPASTFKILNSAIALEEEVVRDEYEPLEWDGTKHTFFGTPVDAWNRDNDMEMAFKNSTVWFYVELAKKIGKENYRHYLEEISYGNGDLSESGDDFWNYGSFGVSPVNQVSFLKAFYREELPFSPGTYQTVKNLLISETEENYTISGKTGWTNRDNKDIGWWIGYVEKEENTWFFATRISKDLAAENPDFSACRIKITQAALHQQGVFE